MDDNSKPKLPSGAKGIEIGEFVIEFRADKVVALKRDTGEHFTIQAGLNSGVIDIHRTWTNSGGHKEHETIVAICRDQIPAILGEMNDVPLELIKLIRRLRLGWLGHRQIGIAWGVLPVEEEAIARVTYCRPRRKRLVFDTAAFKNQILIPEYLDDIWDMPDGPFSLWKKGCMIGIGLKFSKDNERTILRWIKIRDLTRLGTRLQKTVFEIAARHAVPPEQYYKYLFLRRKRPQFA
jgi:hypothetical protein